MPELPEVEIVRQSLEKKVRDKIIQKVLIKNRNLRFKIQSNFQKHLLKKKIKKIDRFSKYIIFFLRTHQDLLFILECQEQFTCCIKIKKIFIQI